MLKRLPPHKVHHDAILADAALVHPSTPTCRISNIFLQQPAAGAVNRNWRSASQYVELLQRIQRLQARAMDGDAERVEDAIVRAAALRHEVPELFG